MAIIDGGVSGALVGVGAENQSGLHTIQFPVAIGSGGAFKLAATSGTMAAALGAGAEIFQFRYVTAASRIALVYKVNISAGMNVAATAAGLASFRMTVARGWTGAGSGGTRLVLTGDNCQLRTAHTTSEVNDAGISTTAALTAGAKVLDATDLSAVATGIGTGAITTAPTLPIIPDTALFIAGGEANHPLVLANQEGFVIRTGAAMPAAMTWHFSVSVMWMEVPNF